MSKQDDGGVGCMVVLLLVWAVSSCSYQEGRVKQLEQVRSATVEELNATKEKLEMLRQSLVKPEGAGP